jgi:phosphoenolpyruvate carboxylase
MQNSKIGVRLLRVSDASQERGYSLAAQEEMTDKHAKTNDIAVIKTWRVDESASKERDRKTFFEMIGFVRQNGVKHIIFDKIDRACRGLKSANIIRKASTSTSPAIISSSTKQLSLPRSCVFTSALFSENTTSTT